MRDDYSTFLASKHVRHLPSGFDVDYQSLNPAAWEWQRKVVAWACRLGRAALFADTGLGKTVMQLMWAEQVARLTNRPVLILTPLAVGAQTVREATKFGIGVPVKLCRDDQDVGNEPSICVTNYERLHKFDVRRFGGVVLDESAILKAYTGKVRNQLCQSFAATPYRLACTATPAPNDQDELGNHAEFLSVMELNVMRSRWFAHDGANTSKWVLRPHAETDFWRWVATWAVCLNSPADLGYDDSAYLLPDLHVRAINVEAEGSEPKPGELFASGGISATSIHAEKRATAEARAKAAADLARGSDPFIVWCDSNAEADALMRAIPEAVEIRGTTTEAKREDYLVGFSEGRYRVLITKPEIAGMGLNWQHCNRMAFVGLSYSYERFYQAVRRCWRFGQTREVEAYLIQTDAEAAIARVVAGKQRLHESMKSGMAAAMRDFQQENVVGHGAPRQAYRPTLPMEIPAWLLSA